MGFLIHIDSKTILRGASAKQAELKEYLSDSQDWNFEVFVCFQCKIFQNIWSNVINIIPENFYQIYSHLFLGTKVEPRELWDISQKFTVSL